MKGVLGRGRLMKNKIVEEGFMEVVRFNLYFDIA